MILRCENLIAGASLVLDVANTPPVCPCGATLVHSDGGPQGRLVCARGHFWHRKSGPFVDFLADVAKVPMDDDARCGACGGYSGHLEACVRERARKMLEGA